MVFQIRSYGTVKTASVIIINALPWKWGIIVLSLILLILVSLTLIALIILSPILISCNLSKRTLPAGPHKRRYQLSSVFNRPKPINFCPRMPVPSKAEWQLYTKSIYADFMSPSASCQVVFSVNPVSRNISCERACFRRSLSPSERTADNTTSPDPSLGGVRPRGSHPAPSPSRLTTRYMDFQYLWTIARRISMVTSMFLMEKYCDGA